MKDNLTSVTLDLAADAIQERGWTQGSGWNLSDAGLCLEGGIAAVVDVPRTDTGTVYQHVLNKCPAYRAVQEYLGTRDSLWIWNDAKARSEQEVIEVLRAAAAVERVKEAAYETTDQPLPVEVPEDIAA